VDNLGVDVI